MLLENGIEKSQVILVYGEPRIGKLLFSLFAITHYLHSPHTAFFSPIAEDLMERRFEGIKEVKDGLINNFLESPQFSPFFFKENYPELKKQYNPLLLLEDIKKAVDITNSKVLILHRFEYFFEIQEFDEAEEFFQELVKFVQLKGFKLFLTTSPSERFVNIPDLIDSYLELRVDIEIEEDKRVADVKYTVHPLAEKIYYFKRGERGLELVPRNMEVLESQKQYSVSIHSSDPWIEKTIRYLLHPSKFKIFEGCKTPDFIQAICKGYEIIFFYDENRELDLDYCRIIKENNLPSRIIYILNKEFVRGGDRISAVDEGCYELLPRTFGIEDVVLTLKRIVGDDFYNINALRLPTSNLLPSKKELCEVVHTLLDGRIFFSFVEAKVEGDPENLVRVMRKSDYLAEDGGMVYMVFLNARKEILEEVVLPSLSKRAGVEIEPIKIVEASDILEKPVC
jgi:archaellum biogenesis ATPase FlaH